MTSLGRTMTLLLEKFKEKESVLVEAIREATDAIYSNCSFASMVRYIALSLEHQYPAVKSELFLWRCFTNPNPESSEAGILASTCGQPGEEFVVPRSKRDGSSGSDDESCRRPQLGSSLQKRSKTPPGHDF
ncbi:hypothetical protein GE061_000038 [Apolygus lucorum]|uniref:Uncharacterized protein n=1 Tax=Apolygus lucorum TaxID=248454 RepID=A0A8S9Y3A2_APOLU|nr:hypothetical protein GE061_000038 [Apolygus lucorum]